MARKKPVDWTPIPNYRPNSLEKLRRRKDVARDTEHCAQKWGSPGQSHPLTRTNTDTLAGGDESAATTLVSIPYPNSAKGSASSLEASMLARVRSIFYSYRPEEIAAWCGVSLGAAKLYKSGKRKPSRQALRLFTLHREERVLGEPWRGWKVRKGVIVDPEGNVTTQAQLRAYWLLLQYAGELARRDPVERDRFWAILATGTGG